MSGNKARHHALRKIRFHRADFRRLTLRDAKHETKSAPRPFARARGPRKRVVFIFQVLFFAGLVVLAEEFYPIRFRTRPSKPPAPMVLRLKSRESRSLPVLLRTV